MSRSYKNIIKVGIATGNNGPWYKARRRLARHINNHNLRNLIANYNSSAVIGYDAQGNAIINKKWSNWRCCLC